MDLLDLLLTGRVLDEKADGSHFPASFDQSTNSHVTSNSTYHLVECQASFEPRLVKKVCGRKSQHNQLTADFSKKLVNAWKKQSRFTTLKSIFEAK